EGADLLSQGLGLALDQRKTGSRPRRRLSRGGEHFRLGIDAGDAADIGRKAECEQSGPGAQINQRMLLLELEAPRNLGKELRRVGRPQFFIEQGGGGKTSHGSGAV